MDITSKGNLQTYSDLTHTGQWGYLNTNSFKVYCWSRKSSACISDTLLVLVKDLSNVNFSVSCLREREILASCIMWFSTVLTSHVWVYLGWGGLELYTLLKSCFMRGCWPTGTLSTRRWVVEIVEHIRLIEQSCKPSWNSVMKSKNAWLYSTRNGISLLSLTPATSLFLSGLVRYVGLITPSR